MYATIDISEKSEGVKDPRLKKYPYYFFSFVTDVDNQRLHFSRIPLFRLDSRSVVAFVPHTSTMYNTRDNNSIHHHCEQASDLCPGKCCREILLAASLSLSFSLFFSLFLLTRTHTRHLNFPP